jgi:two-component sensor histidine kinase
LGKQLFKKRHYRLREIEAYKNIADVHLNQRKLDLAEKELLQVLDQYRQIGYKSLYFTYDLLSIVYNAKNDQKRGLSYRLLMIQTMDNTGSIQERASLLLRVASLYRNLGRNDKAFDWASKASALYQESNHDDFYYQAICAAAKACINTRKYNQARVLLTNAQQESEKSPTAVFYVNMCFGDYYMALQQFDKAEVYYLKAHQFSQKAGARTYLKSWDGDIIIALADIKIRQRNFVDARKYLGLAALSPQLREHTFYITYELASSKVDSAESNFKSSLIHFKKYKRISDSLYNVTKSGQIAELEVQYETREKEQSIKLLNSEAHSQKAKLDKVNLQRDIILAALVLFAIIGVISYRFYRYKQKSNESIFKSHKLIESKNKQLEFLVKEKEWLLKEVHHRVKNNLHTIICLLESQAAFLENDALKAMENSQNRIYTMSLIHQKLYQSDDIQTIDMASYIPELVHISKTASPYLQIIFILILISAGSALRKPSPSLWL